MRKTSSLLAAATRIASIGVAGCLLAMGPAFLNGCQTTEGGTEIPNELRGRQVLAGTGKPAADAVVRLIPVGYVPGEAASNSLFATRTDTEGNFAFQGLPEGQYNILAAKDDLLSYRDSVTVTGKDQSLKVDSLRAPGSLEGRVKLQPQHNPRTATVQLLGTLHYANVAADGRFLLPDLGAGQYRLRVVTTEAGYTPLYATVEVRAGSADTLPQPLEPYYSDIPVVEGLKAVARTDGTILLTWRKSDFPQLHAYIVARDDASAVLPRREALARVSDTSFVDTIYSRTPRAGQHPWHDTAVRAFEYRVSILDRSGDPGPYFDAAVATAIPPSRVGTSPWKPVPGSLPFARRSGSSLVPAQGRLWMLGGRAGNEFPADLWSSADGVAWERATDSLPFPVSGETRAVVLKDSLFVVNGSDRTVRQPGEWEPAAFKLEAWITGDGKAWRRVSDSLPFVPIRQWELAAAAEEAWILAGYGVDGSPRYWHTADGSTWTAYQGGIGPKGSMKSAGLGSKLYVLDSAGIAWSAAPGTAWSRLGDTEKYIGLNHNETLVAHGGKLWFILGGLDAIFTGLENEVWSSTDGATWILEDTNAPFGSRRSPGAASFAGRLWLFGGEASGQGTARDGWYLDGP